MKQIQLTLALALSVVLFQNSHAAILLTEQSVGYGTGNLSADSGLGALNGWVSSLANPQITLTNGSGSLVGTNLGLVASAGDRIFISNSATNEGGALQAVRNVFAPANTFPTGTLAVDTNVYYSFLCKFNNAGDVSANGELVVRLNRQNSGFTAPQHWDLLAKNVGGQIQIGIAKAAATVTNYAATSISAGETVFIVVRQHIIPASLSNDVYDVWINPPRESFGTNELNIPPSSVSVGALPTDGVEDASNTGIGRFHIIPGANAEMDELRITTSWAEATPWEGQCIVAGTAPGNPLSVTNSAEIAATFRIFETGTAPTTRWQLSTNSGATWDDIAGATATTYTTPNLALSQSGNQYRAIVNVGCNGSSATSAVATVTLTTPVVTPPGIIMHDTFLDPELGFDDRSNPPLTSSNSLWYTALVLTDNLTAFGQGGNMVGTPNSGGSSLWLGYFIPTNQLPVHLDIGRSIKVTLPFTPNSFNSHTNNAGLRFGLFDYFDGGTRILEDSAAAGGSLGNGAGVRGYMLNVDFGPTFSENSPLQLLARNFLPDVNLMGTTGDYESLGSGPAGGGYSNAPAFLAGTQYTLEFTVTRADVNSVVVNTTISGGGTNWSHTILDNNYAYHRFDAFGIRPNSLETSADSLTFPEFVVEVVTNATITLPAFNITEVRALSPTSVKLTWESVNGAIYDVLSRDSITSGETTNATIVATGSLTSYTNSPISGTQRYFRISAPPYITP